jgi:pimeloyl-ACP methyl ester carboxylesterase
MISSSLPHVMIAHGSWHTPEAYTSFEAALELRGYDVTIPSLPTTRADGLSKTLSDDCQFFRAKLERLISRGSEVIVVMHSYGGMIGAGSIQGLEKKPGERGGVIALVFMACFIPAATGSLADGVGGSLPPWIQYEIDDKVLLNFAGPVNF